MFTNQELTWTAADIQVLFKQGNKLWVHIEGKRIVVEKAKTHAASTLPEWFGAK